MHLHPVLWLCRNIPPPNPHLPLHKVCLLFEHLFVILDFAPDIVLINFFTSLFVAQKSQKVPEHKMVRTDSRDPSGRLHAYMQMKSSNPLEKSCLASIR